MATDVTIRAKIGTAIVYSLTDDRADPQLLDDPLTGTIYPFLSVTSGITSVDWWLDSALYATRSSAPFDLEGASGGDALPFDLLVLETSGHFLVAVVHRTDSRTETVYSQFFVVNDPAPDEIVCPVTITTPFIDVVGDPDAEVFPNVISCTTQIQLPPVSAGTVNRARAGIGVYPRISGGAAADDSNLQFLETSSYLGKKFGTGFSYVRQVLGKTGPGIFLDSADVMMNPARGSIATLRDRSPNPIALQVWFPICLENSGYKASYAAHRTAFQAVANGDLDTTVFQPFVDICVANGWGTTRPNLWLEIGGEMDVQGLANPDNFARGNVDVCVQAQIHVSRFFKQRLPNVKIGCTRISNAVDTYFLANGASSGKTTIQAWEDEFVAWGNPSVDIDFLFQATYFYATTSQAFLQGRGDTIHALCQKYGWDFGAHEWGLSAVEEFSSGSGDNPTWIQWYYDQINTRWPLWHHGCYFEGLYWSAMLPRSHDYGPPRGDVDLPGFPNSLVKFRQLFGAP